MSQRPHCPYRFENSKNSIAVIVKKPKMAKAKQSSTVALPNAPAKH